MQSKKAMKQRFCVQDMCHASRLFSEPRARARRVENGRMRIWHILSKYPHLVRGNVVEDARYSRSFSFHRSFFDVAFLACNILRTTFGKSSHLTWLGGFRLNLGYIPDLFHLLHPTRVTSDRMRSQTMIPVPAVGPTEAEGERATVQHNHAVSLADRRMVPEMPIGLTNSLSMDEEAEVFQPEGVAEVEEH